MFIRYSVRTSRRRNNRSRNRNRFPGRIAADNNLVSGRFVEIPNRRLLFRVSQLIHGIEFNSNVPAGIDINRLTIKVRSKLILFKYLDSLVGKRSCQRQVRASRIIERNYIFFYQVIAITATHCAHIAELFVSRAIARFKVNIFKSTIGIRKMNARPINSLILPIANKSTLVKYLLSNISTSRHFQRMSACIIFTYNIRFRVIHSHIIYFHRDM